MNEANKDSRLTDETLESLLARPNDLPLPDKKEPLPDAVVPSRAVLAAEILRLRAPLRALLAVVDENDERGEPVIGHDHTDAVNWLLDFADTIRPLLDDTARDIRTQPI
jgi:hypothetical protein